MLNIEVLRQRLKLLNGLRAVLPDFIDKLEHELHVSLTESFKFVSRYLMGVAFLFFHRITLEWVPQPMYSVKPSA